MSVNCFYYMIWQLLLYATCCSALVLCSTLDWGFYLGFPPAVDLCLPVEQEVRSLHSYEAHAKPIGDVPPISVQGRLREHSAFWLEELEASDFVRGIVTEGS